ncbi:peptidylprolyl isomerase [Kitasatospora kifunensis]|uniref:Peptidyl-prolyl cis-trans isomerase n=1 Tax=Kitasatospora kifunensis TaxID=58351 RepID=A0A7W7R7C7_KITKI|nr:peptidylprolyl isomerase [Kitasatospora kifunensis]MBB4926785.1 peptidyl-prolyl cis-trans isomerase B (cyclophilin B) [Kitasatospora kifunensis]
MVSSEQRRRQLAREKYERQQKNRAEAMAKAKRRNTVLGAALAVVVLAAGGAWAGGAFKSDAKKTDAQSAPTQPSTSPTAAASPVDVKGCTTPAAGSPNGKQWKTEPAMTVDTNAKYNVTLNTSCGAVDLQLDPSKAPHTVNSFVFLAGQNYFDHTKCHRLTTSGIYVLQCGDPTGSGSGTPGYSFADENLSGATYPAGTVAMANAGANTNGSQFFLVYKDTQLPPSYTPFGKITGGMDVLNNIAAGGVQGGTGDGAPNANVVLNSVTATKA